MDVSITARKKPTLLELTNKHKITMPILARASEIDVQAVRAAVIYGNALPLKTALQILGGLYRLTGVRYNFEQVDIRVDVRS